MIEVEKKFALTEEERERLLDSAELIAEKSFTDAYYDDEKYSLTTQDIWLRQRDGDWELKIPLHKGGADRIGDQYEELTTEIEIRNFLKIPKIENLESDLNQKGFSIFSKFTTGRKKYEKDGFTIDLDLVDFGDFKFEIGEIELMVNKHEEMGEALEKIKNFAKENGLQITHVRGKVMEYLKRKRPEHFRKLVEANVAKDN